ncbi:MAG: class I SAM-dependent methyltransferase [Acidobacteriota bacterium]
MVTLLQLCPIWNVKRFSLLQDAGTIAVCGKRHSFKHHEKYRTQDGALDTWKASLYQAYVSSGQVQYTGGSAEDFLRGRRAYFQALIRKHFPKHRESRILDIGCGHGALLYFLGREGYCNLRGADASREQVDLACRLGITGIELGEAEDCLRACGKESVDVVALFDVLEHLTRQEFFDLLSEVKRVLSPGGMCIGHVPNAAGLFGAAIRYGDLTHEQAFTEFSIRQAFGALGFGETRCFEDKPVVHGLISLVRRVIWDVGSAPLRLLAVAETAERGPILSRNLLFVATRRR